MGLEKLEIATVHAEEHLSTILTPNELQRYDLQGGALLAVRMGDTTNWIMAIQYKLMQKGKHFTKIH